MKTMIHMAAAFAVLVALGCGEGTTRKDVADARQNLQEEKQETAQARQEGQEAIADAQRDAREQTVNKPVTPGEHSEAAHDVAEAKREAAESIAEEKSETREAAAELKATEQNFQLTQERDAYVKDAEQKLANYNEQIDQLKQKAESAEGTAKQDLDRKIAELEAEHDRAEEALENLKGAELANWKNHQDNVRVAMQNLDSSMQNVR